jgi:hypothetical protein
VPEEHVLTGHFPTKVIKKFRIDGDDGITEEIEGESHRPFHTTNDHVSCSCGKEWEGVDAEENAKEHLKDVAEKIDESVLLLDEKDELYGYAVYNAHANCFVDLPEPMSGRPSTPDHVVKEKDENLLQKIAEDHGLESASHLRVVEIRLANELDKQASEQVDIE